jgi:hypothetical protein
MIEVRRWKDLSEEQRREIELEENLPRKDLTPIERSKTFDDLRKAVQKCLLENASALERQGKEGHSTDATEMEMHGHRWQPDAARRWMTCEKSNMARTSFTSVGSEADSPELLLRPSPATGHAAEMLDVYDPYLGYYAEKFPYKPLQWKMRSTLRAGLLGRLCGHISIYSIVV